VSSREAAEYWGTQYFNPTAIRAEWQAHPSALERLSRLLGGYMREDWFAHNYLDGRPAQQALGVGVGRAEVELEMLKKGYVERFDFYDVSPVGLEHAAKVAHDLGMGEKVRCFCQDISATEIEPDQYDVVTFMASLHHMTDLVPTLETVNRSMKSTGLLWAGNEYIGPDRFNYPPEHADVARSMFLELPRHLRKDWSPVLPLPTPEEVAAADPSEAPHSSLIIPEMEKMFPQLEVTPLYGSFAFIMFWGLNHDALYETPEGTELVRFILAMDKALVDGGKLPHYFAHIVAHKAAHRPGPMIRAQSPARRAPSSPSIVRRLRRRIGRVIAGGG
jgi:SAM-dependent methyltransferase